MKYRVTFNTYNYQRRDDFIRACYERHFGGKARSLTARSSTPRPGPSQTAISITEDPCVHGAPAEVVATANVHCGRLPVLLAAYNETQLAEANTDDYSKIEVTRLCVAQEHPAALPILMRAVLGVGLALGAKHVIAMAASPVHARLYARVGLDVTSTLTPIGAPHGWYMTGHTYTLMLGTLLRCLDKATPAMLDGAGLGESVT